jgi:hypothetical protein
VAAIRFLSPSNPQLNLSGVPAQFVDGVCDIDSTETLRLERMRYLGPPAGVREMGAVQNIMPWEDEILAARNRANHLGTQPANTISDFTEAVQAIGGPGGTGTTSASALTSGTLSPARIADGSLPLAKLDTDVATQAELNAAVQNNSSLPLGGTDGQVLARVGTDSTAWVDNTGSGVILDGAVVDTVSFSSLVPSAEELGAAPITVVDQLPLKADLDPATGKVKASQLPATAGGSTSAGNLLIIRGTTDPVPDGYSARVDFTSGTTMIGTGATYASPPYVVTAPVSAAAATVIRFASPSAIDTTGFTVNFERSNATLTTVTWMAIGASA